MLVLKSKLFNKKKEESSNSSNEKNLALTSAAGLGGYYGGYGYHKVSRDALEKDLLQPELSGRNVNSALNREANRLGVDVIRDRDFGNSAYVNKKGLRRYIDYARKKYPNNWEEYLHDKGITDKMMRQAEKRGDKNMVVLGRILGDGVYAHELGHAHYNEEKAAGLVGKAAHKLYAPSMALMNLKYGHLGAGVAAGLLSGKKNEETGKTDISGKRLLAGTGAGVATTLPVLVAEGLASKRGIKLLKQSGASKEAIAAAKRNLRHAWGTYGGAALNRVGNFAGGQALGAGARYVLSNSESSEKPKKRKKR